MNRILSLRTLALSALIAVFAFPALADAPAPSAKSSDYDHSAFDAILKKVVKGKRVDYSAVKANRSALQEYIRPPKGSAAVHFVFNCASVSCPPLANFAYTEANWINKLWSQTGKFLKRKGEIVVDKEAKTITVIKLFEWYKKDFGGDKGVRDFLSKYGAKEALDPTYKIVTREYNWKNNGL